MNEVFDYILKKNWEHKEVSGGQYNIKICPHCFNSNFKFYINSENGCWDCKVCSEKGNFYQLKAKLGDISEFSSAKKLIGDSYKDIEISQVEETEKDLKINSRARNYLKSRGFSDETIDFFRLGSIGDFITIPHFQDGKLWNIKKRNFVEKGFTRIKGQPTVLYNIDNINYKKPAIVITEGEFDCMAAKQMGIENVVGLTGGAQTFKPEWIPFIQKFSKVFLCLDSDQPGQEGAYKIAEKIGFSKCRNVVLPTKDVNDFMLQYTNEDFKKQFGKAKRFNIKDVSSIRDYIEKIDEWFDDEGEISGMQLNFQKLNGILNGFKAEDLVIMSGDSGKGKCLGKGTKVLMHDGNIKNVEDIVVGDKLMGDDSKPRNVLSLTRGREMMYKVRQKKGDDYVVNESHILSLKKTGTTRNNEKGKVVDISVKDYLDTNRTFRRQHNGYKTGVNFKEQETLVEPYFAGVHLGDGSRDYIRITNTDKEVIDYLYEYADRLGLQVTKIHKNNGCPSYDITKGSKDNIGFSLQSLMREEGFFNGDEKYIPDNYKFNSREKRLELLAGIIDTDGYASNGGYDFINKSKTLAHDVAFLARSLGLYVNIKQCKKGIKSIGFVGTYWRLIISGDCSIIPVKVARRKVAKRMQKKDVLVTGIELEKLKVDDYYGFEIDGNKRFLLGDFTVTHNTTLSLNFVLQLLQNGNKCLLFMFEGKIMYYILRMMSMVAKKPFQKLKDNEQEWAELKKKFAEFELYFYSGAQSDINPSKLKDLLPTGVKLYDIDFVLIDNLQKYVRGVKDVANQTSVAVSELKDMAVDLKIPIMLIAHITKPLGGSIERVTMHDAKSSSTIYQDADIYLTLWKKKKDRDNNFMILTVEKNRMGEGGIDIPFEYLADIGLFRETTFDNMNSNDDVDISKRAAGHVAEFDD